MGQSTVSSTDHAPLDPCPQTLVVAGLRGLLHVYTYENMNRMTLLSNVGWCLCPLTHVASQKHSLFDGKIPDFE